MIGQDERIAFEPSGLIEKAPPEFVAMQLRVFVDNVFERLRAAIGTHATMSAEIGEAFEDAANALLDVTDFASASQSTCEADTPSASGQAA